MIFKENSNIFPKTTRLTRTIGTAVAFGFLNLAFLLFFTNVSFAIGNTTAQFLKIPLAARATAMAAFGAVADDVNAIFYNPAGLSQLTQKELSTSYLKYFTDTNAGFVAVGVPQQGVGVLGLSLTYFNITNLDGRDFTGNQLASFGSSDLGVTLSYAREKFWGELAVGLNLKYVGESIASSNASGFAADLGVLLPLKCEQITLGAQVQNIGTGLKFINDSDPFPLDVKLSAAYRPTPSLVLATDVDLYLLESKTYFSLGGEYWLTREIAGRVGYKAGVDLDPLAGLSGGVGFRIEPYSLDYALGYAGAFGLLHRISLGIKF